MRFIIKGTNSVSSSNRSCYHHHYYYFPKESSPAGSLTCDEVLASQPQTPPTVWLSILDLQTPMRRGVLIHMNHETKTPLWGPCWIQASFSTEHCPGQPRAQQFFQPPPGIELTFPTFPTTGGVLACLGSIPKLWGWARSLFSGSSSGLWAIQNQSGSSALGALGTAVSFQGKASTGLC